jgi:lipoprotein-releasing system permease protein
MAEKTRAVKLPFRLPFRIPAALPFAPFEWLLAGRYLKTRLIALLSFLGIMLGVATLIIVLSVMNGFRKELLDKLVGINGHIFVAAIDSPLTDYPDVAERLSKVYGVRRAVPFVEGQVFASSP